MASTPTKAPAAGAPASRSGAELLQSAEFKHLVSRRWRVSFILLALLFVSYYGYILLVASAKDLVNQPVSTGGVTTFAIPLGVGAILVAWALTAFYVVWANRSYDPEVERLKGQLKR